MLTENVLNLGDIASGAECTKVNLWLINYKFSITTCSLCTVNDFPSDVFLNFNGDRLCLKTRMLLVILQHLNN